MRVHAYAHTQTRTHNCVHARARTLTHTHMHTHTYIHIYIDALGTEVVICLLCVSYIALLPCEHAYWRDLGHSIQMRKSGIAPFSAISCLRFLNQVKRIEGGGGGGGRNGLAGHHVG